ncbi:MAG: hypothetical protein KPEEDBHJ_01633 [Anaerolineales bacterium]|nr:hypothetical protein [Anaerolineales bacterium]
MGDTMKTVREWFTNKRMDKSRFEYSWMDFINQGEIKMTDIKYEIVKTIGAVSKPALSRAEGSASGWSKELNLISWNEREPKYDLRDWSGDKSKMGKGVTLTKEELLALRDLLNSLDL